MFTVEIAITDLLAILALAADRRTPETEAAFARLWVACRRSAPNLAQTCGALVDADGGEG